MLLDRPERQSRDREDEKATKKSESVVCGSIRVQSRRAGKSRCRWVHRGKLVVKRGFRWERAKQEGHSCGVMIVQLTSKARRDCPAFGFEWQRAGKKCTQQTQDPAAWRRIRRDEQKQFATGLQDRQAEAATGSGSMMLDVGWMWGIDLGCSCESD